MNNPAQYSILGIDPGPTVCHAVLVHFTGAVPRFAGYWALPPDGLAAVANSTSVAGARSKIAIECPEGIYRPQAAANILLTALAAGTLAGSAKELGYNPVTYCKPGRWRAQLGLLKGERTASAMDRKIKALVRGQVQNLPETLPVHGYDAIALALALGHMWGYWRPSNAEGLDTSGRARKNVKPRKRNSNQGVLTTLPPTGGRGSKSRRSNGHSGKSPRKAARTKSPRRG